MTVRRSAPVLAAVVLALALGSCASAGTQAPAAPGAGPAVHVDVDTPALQARKQQAGVEPCPAIGPGRRPVTAGLPAVTLPCLGGGLDVDLGGLRGPMVLNLFAQWCGPCREELPYYQKLHENAGDAVPVIGIDYLDTQPAEALALAEQAGVTYPLLADPGSALRAPLRVRGLPVLVLVGKDGSIAYRQAVAIDSYGQLRELVREHLGVKV